jgi:5-hydroxyisourate hydrolase-like protein (transthyretin family)
MIRRALLVVMSLLVAGSPAMAQVLRGTVVDSASGKPVAGAHLLVSVAGGTAVSDTATDKDGRFSFALPGVGQYVLRVSRPGYSTRVTQPVAVEKNFIAAVELRLTPLAVLLDTVTVVAERVVVEQQLPFLVDAGYDRRSKGIGHFLTRADLDQHPPDRMTNAFQGISGVHVVCGGRTSSPNACDVQAPGATTMFKRGVCKLSVVLDGVVLRAGGVLHTDRPNPEDPPVDAPVDQLLNPFNIEAVEIYTSPAGVPVQYIGYLSPCGAIIAWSRR